MKINTAHFQSNRRLLWNDSEASKRENFWLFSASPLIMIFSERIGTFITATLATQQNTSEYWGTRPSPPGLALLAV